MLNMKLRELTPDELDLVVGGTRQDPVIARVVEDDSLRNPHAGTKPGIRLGNKIVPTQTRGWFGVADSLRTELSDEVPGMRYGLTKGTSSEGPEVGDE